MTPEQYLHIVATGLGTDSRGLQVLLSSDEGRRKLTKYDPLLFALVYMSHHLMDGNQNITLSEFHVAVAEYGKKWIKRNAGFMEMRDAFIAPRGCGKSTWLFTILPMWAAAHGHVRFLAAFSDKAEMAERHLATFKKELAANAYILSDYPALCTPERSPYTGRATAQSANMIVQESGFIFSAQGIDTNALGLKVGTVRPDLIVLDDIEKGEKNYSEYQAGQQKNTVFDDIAPMNMAARMVFVGTTTMPNSIMDQFRKYAEGEREQELKWIDEQNVTVHYFPAILKNDDGTERSIWPEKWNLDSDLQPQRHTRSFAKNFMNKPVSLDGAFWSDEDVRILAEGEEDNIQFGNTIISVDPAVTKNKVSDYTGLVVLSRGENAEGKSHIYLRHAEQFKGTSEVLAEKVRLLVEVYDVGVILVETNQGGDLWLSVFKGIDAKIRPIHQKLSKEIRAQKAHDFYQKKKVFHTKHFPVLEEQMYAFPKVKHDDVLDAATSGVLYFLDNKAKPVKARQFSYIGGE